MAQKLAPAKKNSTGISAASATFCISALSEDRGGGGEDAARAIDCLIDDERVMLWPMAAAVI